MKKNNTRIDRSKHVGKSRKKSGRINHETLSDMQFLMQSGTSKQFMFIERGICIQSKLVAQHHLASGTMPKADPSSKNFFMEALDRFVKKLQEEADA